MKLLSRLIPLATALALAGHANATILTVHNDPLYNAQYNSIGSAIAAASAGDTLLVHGSPVSYGSFTLSIPLAIIGHGHDPAAGPAPSFTYATINSGAAGCLIEGISFGYMYQNAPDAIIRGCKFNQFLDINASATGNLISGCVFIDCYLSVDGSAANLEVRNNYFSHSGNDNNFKGGSATTLVHHNVFVRTYTGSPSSNRIFQASTAFSVFADNVFYTEVVAAFNPQDCPNYSFQSNLSYCTAGTLGSLGPNNLDNVAPTWNLTSGSPIFNYDDDYNMLSGTPLTGASDGGQVGVMGGTTPLDNAGRPKNVPLVVNTELLTPYVPVNGTIDVQFQAEQGQPQ
jgi:hypothetical protein